MIVIICFILNKHRNQYHHVDSADNLKDNVMDHNLALETVRVTEAAALDAWQ